ncbi:tetratricopeptide repeat protein [Aquimarina sediminis]|uniref:tetratricopeptide repeat protein n=1 Tax=Aquimarina sediminis TaxID=2070536 RepID=UPI000CA03E6C|nr:tetratricopeptide repeat protein [Aquimarina sediminis]
MNFKPGKTIYFKIIFLYSIFGLSITISGQNTIDEAKKYAKEGKALATKDQYEKSIELFDKAITILKDTKEDQFLSKVYTALGHTYLRKGDNQKALDTYYKALEIAKKQNDIQQEVLINAGVVVVLKRINQLDLALKTVNKMLISVSKTPLNNTLVHVSALATSSEIYLQTGQYDSVLSLANKGIKISKLIDYPLGLVDLKIKKGMVYYYKKDRKKSYQYLFEAKALLDKQKIENNFYQVINSNYFLAANYYEQKLFDKAIHFLSGTITLTKENDNLKPPVIQSYLLMANCYAGKKDFKNSIYWHNKYRQSNDLYQQQKEKTVNTIFEKETQKFEEEIELLKQEQITSEKNRLYILSGLGILSILLTLLMIRYFRKQKNNKVLVGGLTKKIQHLEAAEQQLAYKKTPISEVIIDDQKVKEVLLGLEKLEEQEFFLRVDCNLRSVSKKLKTNVTYLSKIINLHKRKSFNEYINTLRIAYVIQRLESDKKFRSFSIKSISQEVGYKTDYSFAKHFKEKTGMNPSSYIKNIQKN